MTEAGFQSKLQVLNTNHTYIAAFPKRIVTEFVSFFIYVNLSGPLLMCYVQLDSQTCLVVGGCWRDACISRRTGNIHWFYCFGFMYRSASGDGSSGWCLLAYFISVWNDHRFTFSQSRAIRRPSLVAVATLGPGKIFGARSILTVQGREACSLVATSKVTLLTLDASLVKGWRLRIYLCTPVIQ